MNNVVNCVNLILIGVGALLLGVHFNFCLVGLAVFFIATAFYKGSE